MKDVLDKLDAVTCRFCDREFYDPMDAEEHYILKGGCGSLADNFGDMWHETEPGDT